MSDSLETLRRLDPGGCREWVEEKHNCCFAPSEFVLWGKLFPPEALGPRCYDHAARYVGHSDLGRPEWAVMDLRPMRRLLESDSEVAA